MNAPVLPGAVEGWETALWRTVTAQFHGDPDRSIHGAAHWRRVLRNGLLLATRTGADVTVVRLFAVFHDSRRYNDMDDPHHGVRGAEYAAKLRAENLYQVADAAFALLEEACNGHTDGFHHDDLTVGTCWDADRLDLGRCGMTPDAHFMSTEFAREIARAGSVQPFLAGANLPISLP